MSRSRDASSATGARVLGGLLFFNARKQTHPKTAHKPAVCCKMSYAAKPRKNEIVNEKVRHLKKPYESARKTMIARRKVGDMCHMQ